MLRVKIKPCMSKFIPHLASPTWLILPAEICFELKLSHACLSSFLFSKILETASRLLLKVNSYEIILSALIFSLKSQFEKMAQNNQPCMSKFIPHIASPTCLILTALISL